MSNPMPRYRVELQAITTVFEYVDADDAESACDYAFDIAYDEVHEVDRATWTAIGVEQC